MRNRTIFCHRFAAANSKLISTFFNEYPTTATWKLISMENSSVRDFVRNIKLKITDGNNSSVNRGHVGRVYICGACLAPIGKFVTKNCLEIILRWLKIKKLACSAHKFFNFWHKVWNSHEKIPNFSPAASAQGY